MNAAPGFGERSARQIENQTDERVAPGRRGGPGDDLPRLSGHDLRTKGYPVHQEQ